MDEDHLTCLHMQLESDLSDDFSLSRMGHCIYETVMPFSFPIVINHDDDRGMLCVLLTFVWGSESPS